MQQGSGTGAADVQNDQENRATDRRVHSDRLCRICS